MDLLLAWEAKRRVMSENTLRWQDIALRVEALQLDS